MQQAVATMQMSDVEAEAASQYAAWVERVATYGVGPAIDGPLTVYTYRKQIVGWDKVISKGDNLIGFKVGSYLPGPTARNRADLLKGYRIPTKAVPSKAA